MSLGTHIDFSKLIFLSIYKSQDHTYPSENQKLQFSTEKTKNCLGSELTKVTIIIMKLIPVYLNLFKFMHVGLSIILKLKFEKTKLIRWTVWLHYSNISNSRLRWPILLDLNSLNSYYWNIGSITYTGYRHGHSTCLLYNWLFHQFYLNCDS